jgi:AbrB family looped-hinge helix DNA binding protein
MSHKGITFMAATTITSKGQVTIPKNVRDGLGVREGSKVEIVLDGLGHAVITPCGGKRAAKDDYMKRIEKVRGTLKSDMTTDEIMEFLRGE